MGPSDGFEWTGQTVGMFADPNGVGIQSPRHFGCNLEAITS